MKEIKDRLVKNETDIDSLEDRLEKLEGRHKSPWWRHPSILKILQHAIWIVGLILSYFITKGPNADGN